jgi:hypothetical protein
MKSSRLRNDSDFQYGFVLVSADGSYRSCKLWWECNCICDKVYKEIKSESAKILSSLKRLTKTTLSITPIRFSFIGKF